MSLYFFFFHEVYICHVGTSEIMYKSSDITGFLCMHTLNVAICKPLTCIIFRNLDYFEAGHGYFKACCICYILHFLNSCYLDYKLFEVTKKIMWMKGRLAAARWYARVLEYVLVFWYFIALLHKLHRCIWGYKCVDHSKLAFIYKTTLKAEENLLYAKYYDGFLPKECVWGK